MRVLLLAVLLLSCYEPPRHIMGKWERVVASGTWTPAGTIDRMTIWYEGELLRERDGGALHGQWEEDEFNNITFKIGGAVEIWKGSDPDRCPDGSPICLRLQRESEDDWYRGGFWR